jgi:hypothetical protein
MEQIPTESEINAASGFIVAITTLVVLIIRAIEKRRDKRKLKKAIREGKVSLFDDIGDPKD